MIKFDAITSIEAALMRNGYIRYRTDQNNFNLVEMPPHGDPAYYFSAMKNLDFTYTKNELVFKVGLLIDGDSPTLISVKRNDKNAVLKVHGGNNYRNWNEYPMLNERIYKHVGEDNFIKAIETGNEVDVPCILQWYEEVTKLYEQRFNPVL